MKLIPWVQKISGIIISLVLLMGLCFVLIRFFPGNPYSYQDEISDPLVIEKLNTLYPKDKNILEQLGLFFAHLATGDLGQSLHYQGKSVNAILVECAGPTLILGGAALFISLIVSCLYAILTRIYRKEKWDYFLLVLYSIPLLSLAPFLIWLLCYHWALFPLVHLNSAKSYVLPIFILSLKPSMSLSRILSESIDRNFRESYASYAQAQGFSRAQVVGQWILRNSWGPYLIQLASVIVGLLSGSLLVEMIFSIPGLGQQFIGSVLNRDWPLVAGLTFIYGFAVILVHSMADTAAKSINPRAFRNE